jgi:Neuraminidase (sialidase)
MFSQNGMKINGFPESGPLTQQSTFASQASTLAQQDGENETLLTSAALGNGSAASWGRPLVTQKNQQGESLDPMEDLQPKNWEELDNRYERDMEAAILQEQSILTEIEWVMKVCDSLLRLHLGCTNGISRR